MVCLCVSVIAFAQSQPKQVLAKADIDNFVKNFTAIQELLDAHVDDLTSVTEGMDTFEADDMQATFAKIRSFAVPPDLKKGLSGLGMGDNGFEKIMVILYSVGIVMSDQMLQEMGVEEQEGAAIIKEQMQSMRDCIHVADMSLIASRSEELMSILENM
jgi:hypothetical protein